MCALFLFFFLAFAIDATSITHRRGSELWPRNIKMTLKSLIIVNMCHVAVLVYHHSPVNHLLHVDVIKARLTF